MKKILILGAGMVAGPIIKYLLNKGYIVTVASNTPERAKELIGSFPKGTAVVWEATQSKELEDLIKNHDIIVSLLPYTFHVMVAEKCIKHKKDMVTTSYVKPEMKALDKAARDAGIIILNECGLDPGIDHMSAKRIIDTIHGFGGKVIEFYSLCGALPAPEFSNENPFRYKFTWSPKGVVLASNNDAHYLKNGKEIHVKTENLFNDTFGLKIGNMVDLEVYPNRDSLPYKELYDITEAKTMFRGTIRYKGWCQIIDAFKKLKLTLPDLHDFTGMTYSQMILHLVGVKKNEPVKKAVAQFLKVSENHISMQALDFLGLFSEQPMNRSKDSTYEIVSDLMIHKMMLPEQERDMSLMQHIFLAEYPDGRKEVIKSKLLDFGIPGKETSVARTVALPAACAVRMILEEEISLKGVHIPVLPEIYNPILIELENMGIEMIEEYGLPLSHNIE